MVHTSFFPFPVMFPFLPPCLFSVLKGSCVDSPTNLKSAAWHGHLNDLNTLGTKVQT